MASASTTLSPEGQRAEAQSRLAAHFSVDPSAHSNRWDALWRDASFLPWDRGEPAPALLDILAQRVDLIGTPLQAAGSVGASPAQSQHQDGVATSASGDSTEADGGSVRRKALVPGCGKGYDCYALQAKGWDVTGLDVSEAATVQAKALEDKLRDGDAFGAGQFGKGDLQFKAGDFFSLGEEYMGKWDLIWDYTFLCALPPELRPKWSRQMSKLLSKSGRLVCLEFPTTKDPKAGGPPWALPPPTYVALLSRPGDEIKYGEDGKVLPEDQQGPSNEFALERIAHFQPERSFAAGQGNDWISVWKKRSG